ncbi:MAG: LCP family protein [Chloroflexi bacterium]|nr:LCP family protein [Chloroflexota bacterium]
MLRLKPFSSPLWRSRPLLLLLFFCLVTICSFSVIHEIYSRPLNPVSALMVEPAAADIPVAGLPPEDNLTESLTPDPPSVLSGALLLAEGDQGKGSGQEGGASLADVPLVEVVPAPRDPSGVLGQADCVTILVMGVDSRMAGGLISRTDTLMLLQVCPQAQTVSLLSIPRDLYVSIPGVGNDRINAALVYGAAAGDAAAGVALVMETVQTTFQVPIDHYILVDFHAVIDAIDALGGVDIYVPYTIDDPTFPDMNFGYDPLYLAEGEHHFDGAMALKYARTRHQDNDFYRARRQQQLLFALHQKVLALGLANFLEQVPTLYEKVRYGVFTDLSLEQIVALTQLADTIPPENITANVLDENYVQNFTTPGGASVLLLLPAETQILIAEMFSTPATAATIIQNEP